MKYLHDLNNAQKEAVLHTEGPLLIIAGAGAGKTKTLTHRIAHLIHKGVSPDKILAVTFTNKAAKEMRDRIQGIIKRESEFLGKTPFVSTFHSLGVHILKENSRHLGVTRYFKIMDDQDSTTLIKQAMRDSDIDPKEYEPRKIKNIISREKGNFVTEEEYRNRARDFIEKMVSKVWEKYEAQLKQENGFDFDDLLLKTALLLQNNEVIRNKYQDQWHHIHIDEYQDTNTVQYKIVNLLARKRGNICVVGDSDQNIYSWRGADVQNILDFEEDYPGTKTVLLEQNYRSTKNILHAANEVIKKNELRKEKNLFTSNDEGEKITLFEAFDEKEEAQFVGDKIKDLISNGDMIPDSIAVLYRTNFQSRVLEEKMLELDIPYQVLGVKFFERKEVKDVLSYLRAALNPSSLSDIKRIINFPRRGIGKVTLAKLFSNQADTLPSKIQEKIRDFYTFLNSIQESAETLSVSEVVKFVIKKSGIEETLKKGTEEDLERLLNIHELATLATKYDAFEGIEGVERLLEDAALATDQDNLEKNNGGVKLMTVHASKGLEFKHVFITGLEQGLFPQEREAEDTILQEEERRLFYVALTRAEDKLYLSFANTRTIFGSRETNFPSEFLQDIPENIIERESGLIQEFSEKIVYLD